MSEPGFVDFEGVPSWRKEREAKLPRVAGDERRGSADQGWRADADDRARDGRPLFVLDRPDDGSGQPLCRRGPRQQEAPGRDRQQQGSPDSVSGWPPSSSLHVARRS